MQESAGLICASIGNDLGLENEPAFQILSSCATGSDCTVTTYGDSTMVSSGSGKMDVTCFANCVLACPGSGECILRCEPAAVCSMTSCGYFEHEVHEDISPG